MNRPLRRDQNQFPEASLQMGAQTVVDGISLATREKLVEYSDEL